MNLGRGVYKSKVKHDGHIYFAKEQTQGGNLKKNPGSFTLPIF